MQECVEKFMAVKKFGELDWKMLDVSTKTCTFALNKKSN